MSLSIYTFALLLLFAAGLDSKKINPSPSFVYSDNMMGTILQSSEKREIGKKISFISVSGENPTVLFESGQSTPVQKVFESDETLTLLLVASGTGSIDGFVIDKKTGIFSRISAGSVLGIYSAASLGRIN